MYETYTGWSVCAAVCRNSHTTHRTESEKEQQQNLNTALIFPLFSIYLNYAHFCGIDLAVGIVANVTHQTIKHIEMKNSTVVAMANFNSVFI